MLYPTDSTDYVMLFSTLSCRVLKSIIHITTRRPLCQDWRPASRPRGRRPHWRGMRGREKGQDHNRGVVHGSLPGPARPGCLQITPSKQPPAGSDRFGTCGSCSSTAVSGTRCRDDALSTRPRPGLTHSARSPQCSCSASSLGISTTRFWCRPQVRIANFHAENPLAEAVGVVRQCLPK